MEQDLEGMGCMGYSEELIEGRIRTEWFDAWEEGFAKGFAIGLEEGFAIGKEEVRAETVRSYVWTVTGMLSKGLTLEEAMELVPNDNSEDVLKSMRDGPDQVHIG